MYANTIKRKSPARFVDCIMMTSEVHNNLLNNEDTSKKRQRQFFPTSYKTIPQYSKTVEKRVELINKELSSNGKPYRYAMRSNDKGLLVDMLILDPQGKTIQQYTKVLTPDNYRGILDKMMCGGFLFDD